MADGWVWWVWWVWWGVLGGVGVCGGGGGYCCQVRTAESNPYRAAERLGSDENGAHETPCSAQSVANSPSARQRLALASPSLRAAEGWPALSEAPAAALTSPAPLVDSGCRSLQRSSPLASIVHDGCVGCGHAGEGGRRKTPTPRKLGLGWEVGVPAYAHGAAGLCWLWSSRRPNPTMCASSGLTWAALSLSNEGRRGNASRQRTNAWQGV